MMMAEKMREEKTNRLSSMLPCKRPLMLRGGSAGMG
jgi:hypothetical protein